MVGHAYSSKGKDGHKSEGQPGLHSKTPPHKNANRHKSENTRRK